LASEVADLVSAPAAKLKERPAALLASPWHRFWQAAAGIASI
jgi:hypothetical protein